MNFLELGADDLSSPPQALERIRIIQKYYPQLVKQTTVGTFASLVADWYANLAHMGLEDINHYVSDVHTQAVNKTEFLTCLAGLLTEAERYAHLPEYGHQAAPAGFLPNPTQESLSYSGRAALREAREWYNRVTMSWLSEHYRY